MISLVKCAAKIKVNGNVVGTSISAGVLKGNWLYLRVEDTSYSFGIFPFPPETVTRWCKLHPLTKSCNFQFFGDNLGFAGWGPRGPDGEGEVYVINSLSLKISYSTDSIYLELQAHTSTGRALFRGIPDPDNPKPLPAWMVLIEFSVPNELTGNFLSISDIELQPFFEALSTL